MMLNLFSIFDPSTSSSLSLNWSIIFMMILILPINFYLKNNLYQYLLNKIPNSLNQELSQIMGSKKTEGFLSMIIIIFSIIFWANYLGLFPFIFTTTSHLIISFSLSLSIWIALMMYGWMNNMKIMFSHLVPLGTPPLLMMFMVMIETISLLIRPITLAVRLTANMIAGHLLLTLLGSSFFNISQMYYPSIYAPLILLLILEMAVAMIQAYVFSMLVMLYSMEIS